MRPKKIYITRHGESIGNVDWRNYFTYKDEDLMLTAKGTIQATKLGLELKERIEGTARIHSSHYKRALDTATAVQNALGSINAPEITVHEDLRELRWCDKNVTFEEFANTQANNKMGGFRAKNPGGESPHDVWKRQEKVLDALEQIWQQEDYPENCIIVCHGITMLTLVMRLCKIPQKQYETFATPHNCEIIELSWNGSEYEQTVGLRQKDDPA